MTKDSFSTSDYATWLADLKSRILSARLSVARSVNRDLIVLYWDIGHAIVEKQQAEGWGESVVERLARDLAKAFPTGKGFSSRNLRDMKRLYVAYSEPTFWRQAVAKLDAGGKEVEIWRQLVANNDHEPRSPKKP